MISYSDYTIELLEREADKGDAEAMFQLGKYYSTRHPEDTYDADKAIPLLRQAIALGHKEAKRTLGFVLWAEGKTTEVAELFKEAATNGDVQAQWALGEYLLDNGDPKEGVKWLSKVASNGDKWCSHLLAQCYEEGHGVRKNVAKAKSIWEKLEDEGYTPVNLALGRIYYFGVPSVAKDYAKAVANFTKSITEGEVEGLLGLASIYDHGGHGVSRNLKAAYLFYYLYDLLASEYYDDEDRKYVPKRLSNIGELLSLCNGGRSIEELREEWLPEPLVSILVRSLSD